MKFRIVFCLIILFCIGLTPVFACTPTITPTGVLPPTQTFQQLLSAKVERASLIFVGSVTDGIVGQDGVINQAIITTELSLKGQSANQFIIDGFGRNSMCRIEISFGARAVFFVQVDGAGNFFIQTIDAPTEELIAQIAALTGQSISIAVSPSPTATVTLTSTLTNTPTATATITASSTYTPTYTYTPSYTPTATLTATWTATTTLTPTLTITPSPTPVPAFFDFSSSNGLTNTVVLLGSSLIALSLIGFWILLRRRGRSK